MSKLLERLRENFQDEEARYAYVDAFLNASIAAQIKSYRDAEGMSQQDLADKIGTKQSGISRLENANYSSWKVETLRKLARAFGLRLRISFEEFGTIVPEVENFERRLLRKRPFMKDPKFHPALVTQKPPQSETVLSAMPQGNDRSQEPSDPLEEIKQRRPNFPNSLGGQDGFTGVSDLGRASNQ